MSVEEINTLHEFMSKYASYWELVQEAAEAGNIDLSRWEFDSVIEECGAIEVRLVDSEYDELFIVAIDTSDNTWEARYER